MDLFNEYKGQVVTVTSVDDQIFCGTLCSIDENTGKIVLKNVSTNGSKLPGLQNFYVSSIKELSLNKQLQASRVSYNPRRDGRRRHMTPLYYEDRRGKQDHLKKLLRFDSDQLVRSHCMGADSGDQGIGSGEDNETYDDFYEEENYTVFCQSCDKFRESIVCLMEQNVIAVTFYGTDIGRKGTLSLVQVATENDIFLYDILRLGDEGFVDGLQAVLESTDVLKVIHDCRMISDLLYHQYQVSLANVFDSQVASAFVFRSSNDGNWPRFVESLPGVLMSQLGLRNEDVHHFFVRERLRQRDEEVWLQRPLCTQLVKDSLKNLIYMIPLYDTLLAKMITDFHVGVQLYLDQVRNAPKHKVDDFMSFSHLLPFVFQDIPKLTKQYSNLRCPINVKYTGSHGFVDVCPMFGPNMVTTSRDSIWHSRNHFCEASCKCVSKSNTSNSKPDEGQSRTTHKSDSEGSCVASSRRAGISKRESSVKLTAETTGNSNLNNHCNSPSQDITKNICENVQNEAKLHESSACMKSKLLDLPSLPSTTKETVSISSISNNSHTSLPSSQNQSKSNSPCKTKSSKEPLSSVTSSVEQKYDLNEISNRLSSTFKSGQTLTHCGIHKPRYSALEKSALLKLGSSQCSSLPLSCEENQPESIMNSSREGMSQYPNEHDIDNLYELEMVRKVLKYARQEHLNTMNTSGQLLAPKSKVSLN